MLRFTLSPALFVALGVYLPAEEPTQAVNDVTSSSALEGRVFEKDVLPILAREMFVLSWREKVQQSGTGPEDTGRRTKRRVPRDRLWSPGKPEESLLLEVLHDGLMPPSEEGTPLTDAEAEVVHQWVAAGAGMFAQPGSCV